MAPDEAADEPDRHSHDELQVAAAALLVEAATLDGHYGEAEHRNIYGEATMEEALDLSEEGVEFDRVPWVPRADS